MFDNNLSVSISGLRNADFCKRRVARLTRGGGD